MAPERAWIIGQKVPFGQQSAASSSMRRLSLFALAATSLRKEIERGNYWEPLGLIIIRRDPARLPRKSQKPNSIGFAGEEDYEDGGGGGAADEGRLFAVVTHASSFSCPLQLRRPSRASYPRLIVVLHPTHYIIR
jgi:hypothetical protein